MIDKIIEFSANNRFIVILITALLAVMGWWSMGHLPLDAIPDLSETQVLIYSKWDRSPDIVEDQVTYPIVSAMLGGPRVKSVRGFSDFGYSYVYVIFEEGTDIYWARSRTLEYLSAVQQRLPQGVQTELGPDATGLGWIYQYALVDTTGSRSLAELRSYQDWYLRYYLKSVPGVAEVAPIGGFRQQYQVNLDPRKLQFYGIPLTKVLEAVKNNNSDVGGRLIEFGGTEYMVRGRGYAKSITDFENIAVTASENGTVIRVKELGQVVLGPDYRRGVSDLDGTGEAVSGIVVMRQGQNALDVISRVKAKIKEIEPGLPAGVKIVPVYDRSDLIIRAIDNLKGTLLEVMLTVSVVILFFLWHFPSAIIPSITIPLAVGTIHPEQQHPVSRFLIRWYEPVVTWALRRRWLVIGGATLMVVATVPVYLSLGTEFMPPLDEGSLMYMPSTMPGISVAEAQKLLQITDRIIKRFPEVERVFGKAGRAESATDPAPLSMLETVIILKDKEQWRHVDTWYSSWAPGLLKGALRPLWPDRISREELISQLDTALKIPGVSNAWTMPIKGRIDMLTTGIRTPVGLKISGANLVQIEQIGGQVEALLRNVKGTRGVFAERTGGGYFLDITWNRDELARHGLSVSQAQESVQNAIGGENITTTVEGRERYSVNVRYLRDFRSDLGALQRVLVPAFDGKRQIPLAELAEVTVVDGPAMIRNEDGIMTGYVYLDIADRDPAGYIAEAAKLLRSKVELPPGYALSWSGQYEAMRRVHERLEVVVPLTLLLILGLLYMNTRSMAKTALIMLAVPFSAIGAIWFLWFLGYNMSIGVWVGLIALLGVDAETGVFMLLYLELAYAEAKQEGRMGSLEELQQAIQNGAVKRIRPKLMTVACMFLGLLPVMWATGTGSDVMKHIAAPLIGGILTSFILELIVYPVFYELWKWHTEVKSKEQRVKGEG